MAAALPAGLALAGLLSGPALPAEGPGCALPPGKLKVVDLPAGTSAVECNAVGRLLTNGQLTVRVPAPGLGIKAEAIFPDSAQEFSMLVTDSGTVEYPIQGAASAEYAAEWDAEGILAGNDACTDKAFHDKDLEQAGPWEWHIGDGARPDGMTNEAVVDALRDSVHNIVGSDNDCGLADLVDAQADFQGPSPLETDMTSVHGETVCGDGTVDIDQRDHESVVDFGNLDGRDANGNPKPPVGLQCEWFLPQPFNDNNILESDVRFNIREFTWTNAPLADSCHGDYDLRSVATHEFGHSYGLGHVSEAEHPWLTMSTEVRPCRLHQRTLGRGDVYGLRNTY
jgi:hypothetical protein